MQTMSAPGRDTGAGNELPDHICVYNISHSQSVSLLAWLDDRPGRQLMLRTSSDSHS